MANRDHTFSSSEGKSYINGEAYLSRLDKTWTPGSVLEPLQSEKFKGAGNANDAVGR